MLVVMCLLLIPVFIFLLRVSQKTLPIIVAILCVVGTYGSQNVLFDVFVMFFFAIIGVFLKILKFPVAPMVVAIVLGTEFEVTFRQTLGYFQNDLTLIFMRPIAVVLLCMCAAVIVLPIVRLVKHKVKTISE
jgi:putative tricarboxylic transport membrane protein